MSETTYLGRKARKMRPTKAHRPAIWECMLGTVNAMNDERQVRYFDYDWDAAFEYAGYDKDRDPRVWRFPGTTSYADGYWDNPRKGKLVLWIK